MKSLISIKSLLIAALLVFSAASFSQKSDAPWKVIFNGQNLDGWKMVGDKGQAYVKDGEIVFHMVAETKEHTFITTKKKYADFILEADFLMDGPGFSTGVLVRCVDAKADTSKVRLYGYQIKIDNTPRSWTGGIFDDFGGSWKWMYDLSKNEPARNAYKKNEWNQFRIEAIGNNMKVWLNGVPATNLISNKYAKGYIALKIHSLPEGKKKEEILVHFKNIRIISKNAAKYAKQMDIKQITVD